MLANAMKKVRAAATNGREAADTSAVDATPQKKKSVRRRCKTQEMSPSPLAKTELSEEKEVKLEV